MNQEQNFTGEEIAQSEIVESKHSSELCSGASLRKSPRNLGFSIRSAFLWIPRSLLRGSSLKLKLRIGRLTRLIRKSVSTTKAKQ